MTEWSNAIVYRASGVGDKIEYPNANGVYLICERIEGHARVRYVGKGNIRERMVAHYELSEQNTRLRELMNERIGSVEVYYTLTQDMANFEFTAFTRFDGPELYNEVTPEGHHDPDATYPQDCI